MEGVFSCRWPPARFPGVLEFAGLAGVGLLAASLGYLGTRDMDLLRIHFSPTWTNFLSLVVLFGLGVKLYQSPNLALMSLVAFIFLNLSQVLVRFHSLPSCLQFLVLPLAATAWIHRNRGSGASVLGNPLTLAILGYTVIAFSSTIVARDQVLADQRCLELLKAAILHCLIVLLANTRERVRTALWSLFGAATLLAGLGVWQVVTGGYHLEWGGLARIKYAQIYGTVFEPRIAGPLGDPNFFAQMLLLALPIGLFAAPVLGGPLRSGVIFGASAALVGGIVFSYSRGGALALGTVLGLWTLGRQRGWKDLGLGIGVLLALWLSFPAAFTRRLTTIPEMVPGNDDVIHPDSSIEKRKLLARVGWRIFQEHFVLGVGAGNFTTHFEEQADEVGSASRDYDNPAQLHYPHNLYLEIGSETGVVGLAAFGLVLAFGFLQLDGARRRFIEAGDRKMAGLTRGMQVALIGYLISSTFLHLQYPRYFWLVLALVAALGSISRAASARAAATAEAGDPG